MKTINISKQLAQNIGNYDNPDSIGSKFRAKRILPLISMINKVYEKHGEVSILDIGGRKNYWSVLPEQLLKEYKIYITIVNFPGEILPETEEHYKFIHGDGCNLNFFDDNSFHIAHSNSVIEHVGDWQQMVSFAKEVRRLAPNIYLQTPYFWFPIEPHFMCPFFHWLPRPVRISLVMRFALGNHQRYKSVGEAASKLEHYRLLDRKMLQYLFPDADITSERFIGLTKSLTAIRYEKD
ncbi:class I SAM-dependent methyltransferase [Anabaena sphaerica FACHB-251]|uniref:Class I SAM-dependent methyltransferase n=1 Tax=Anabaena sphaerica FACHB-251 TaxID=2692883 RepID=A0A926ZZ51_9NOST|nr:class I SAM-dependent methyltransferase [Anabaena sphaerica]MBD2293422.1 class I SAM-dependent methyltransferase [Anabaena sphaerica FACHB-251]